MTAFLGLQTFYQHIKHPHQPVDNEIGHFNIFRVEDLLFPKDRPVTYSRRNFFKISIVSGHSRMHYADKSIEVRSSTLVFTNPMIPYHWERISEQQSGYVCIFTEAFFSRFANIKDYPVFADAHNAVIPLKDEEAPQYLRLFERMSEELAGDYPFKYDLLRTLLMEIIHGAQKMQPAISQPASDSNAASRITALFAELLERQFPIELSSQVIRLHTPAAFAAKLNIHVNHLNKALKETTGQTTSQLISSRIIQEAKVLLKSTNWTVNEIAWSLGFSEPNHFSSFFRNQAGITPKKFRQGSAD